MGTWHKTSGIVKHSIWHEVFLFIRNRFSWRLTLLDKVKWDKFRSGAWPSGCTYAKNLKETECSSQQRAGRKETVLWQLVVGASGFLRSNPNPKLIDLLPKSILPKYQLFIWYQIFKCVWHSLSAVSQFSYFSVAVLRRCPQDER